MSTPDEGEPFEPVGPGFTNADYHPSDNYRLSDAGWWVVKTLGDIGIGNDLISTAEVLTRLPQGTLGPALEELTNHAPPLLAKKGPGPSFKLSLTNDGWEVYFRHLGSTDD